MRPLLLLLHLLTLLPLVAYAVTSSPPSSLKASLILLPSTFAYLLTYFSIPFISNFLLKANMYGLDIGKRGTPTEHDKVPEALGIVPGTVWILLLCLSLPLLISTHPSLTLPLLSSLFTVLFMLFLGFTDDVLEWPWRVKLLLPAISSIPLISVYEGSTSILCPNQLTWIFWTPAGGLTNFSTAVSNFITAYPNSPTNLIDIKYFYYLYMSLLSIFTTNSINIYAGINGLEVGQSCVIAGSILTHNVWSLGKGVNVEGSWFSVALLGPFLASSLALCCYNWYPAKVFVGDTYCYFSGVIFAVVGIHGHFSKTLLLFLMPQVLNFLISIPQLFKIVPCPRHRLPRYVKETGLMTVSRREDGGMNLTLINVVLKVCGDMKEEHLTMVLLMVQVGFSGLGFAIRYGGGSSLFFNEEL
ncbi:hypothetical protein TrST_g2307 [Triparma strigata]|uniref:UDP-N-acetylglucosamine--dolichyl-phosphate N-acetylglucosaminephosphotransferase n=1 Tax=Triparma strigata TaxID=1606541 RepID=A0A9W7BKL4_9STRA|nr:hypothetical protein TrST_g2307 [Triparma strigata]